MHDAGCMQQNLQSLSLFFCPGAQTASLQVQNFAFKDIKKIFSPPYPENSKFFSLHAITIFFQSPRYAQHAISLTQCFVNRPPQRGICLPGKFMDEEDKRPMHDAGCMQQNLQSLPLFFCPGAQTASLLGPKFCFQGHKKIFSAPYPENSIFFFVARNQDFFFQSPRYAQHAISLTQCFVNRLVRLLGACAVFLVQSYYYSLPYLRREKSSFLVGQAGVAGHFMNDES